MTFEIARKRRYRWKMRIYIRNSSKENLQYSETFYKDIAKVAKRCLEKAGKVSAQIRTIR